MAIGRNDPCPCGSGRKHKQCCGRNAAPSPDPLKAARDAARREPVWAVEAVPLNIGIESDRGARPVIVLVTAGPFVVHERLQRRLAGEPTAVAAALADAVIRAGQQAGVLPERVRVRHPELVAPLAERLSPGQIEVEVVDSLPELREAACSLMEHLAGDARWPPASSAPVWTGWELPRERIGALFAAAAAYWRARPWVAMDNEQAPRVRLPSGREWTACVLGAGGEEFGLALYSNAADVYATIEAADGDAWPSLRGRVLSLTFSAEKLVAAAAREARLARWEVAAPQAFPILFTIDTPGGGVSLADTAELEAALRALPAFAARFEDALAREQRGLVPEPTEWTDPATGVAFVYDGRADAGVDIDLFDVDESAATALRLSRADLMALLDANWSDEHGAIRLRRDLPDSEIAHTPIVRLVRTFLGYVQEHGGLERTGTGNLRRADVAALLQLEPFDHREGGLEHGFTVNEPDAPTIHWARILAELAGLTRIARKLLVVSPLGYALLAGDTAELYALLFETAFRRYNLDHSAIVEWPEVQHQLGYTLWALAQTGGEWRPMKTIHEEVFLPILEATTRLDYPMITPLYFEHVIARPLERFGLIEQALDEETVPGMRYPVRTTRLFGRFLSFHLPDSPGLRVI